MATARDSHRPASGRPAVLARREFSRARGRRGGGWSLVLAADVEGKVWLFTLGPEGTPTQGGSMVTEIGPLADVSPAPEYLLRISHAVAAPGAKSGVHTHPGTEAWLVLEGQLSQQTPHGVNVVGAGQTLAGGPAEHPMEVTNSGGEELRWLIMFVVDANKPFASDAQFE